ncbi:MAG: LAGLIDADG family homing endonuclease [Pseudonocardiaceae bacterium]
MVKNKCVAAGTRVFDPVTGQTHLIENVVDEQLPVHVVAADKAGVLHSRPVVSWFAQGEQDVMGLRLRDGTELWVTPDHKILTEGGWRPAGQLAAGDRVARPREFLGFGDAEPVTPEHARLLGYLIGDGYVGLAPEKQVPPPFFTPDVSAEVVSNLLFGLFETDGYVSREQPGGVRVGYTTTSAQLAQQVHWLLLRWGIGSTVRRRDPSAQRSSMICGRRVSGKLPGWEVRIAGVDNVSMFADAVPMWGPRGNVLVRELASLDGRCRRSQRVYLSAEVTEPVLSHLASRGVTVQQAAQLIRERVGDPQGGMRQVLGGSRLRRDRIVRLADALDDAFLQEIIAEELCYSRVVEVLPSRRCRTFDIEVDELHNFVANDVVVHNCAPPFKQAEFDILYGHGISREGSLIDLGVEQGVVRKSGSWYTYEGDQLGQGKENARKFLGDNPDIAAEIEKRIKDKLGIGAKLDDDGTVPAPVDF